MLRQNQKFGYEAEDSAAVFLQSKGYIILERNYRTRLAEIDIIAKHDEFLVFVEVKARTNTRKGFPRETIGFAKQKKIILAAKYYLRENGLFNARVRFDVVSIIKTGEGLEFELIANAFSAL